MLFRALADPTRRALFERLCREGEQTVGALTARAGVSQPAVSKHLVILRQAGLVRDRHEGRQTHYSAQLGALAPLIDWTSQMAGFRLASGRIRGRPSGAPTPDGSSSLPGWRRCWCGRTDACRAAHLAHLDKRSL